jgi:ribosomal RNA-processing protein 8
LSKVLESSLLSAMFAVPGWKVGATIATLTQNGSTEPKNNAEKRNQPPTTGKAEASLKRKVEKVDDGNVEEVWSRVVEGKSVEKPSKKAKKKDKRKESESKWSKKDSLDAKSKTRHVPQGNGSAKSTLPKTDANPKASLVEAPKEKLTPLQTSMRAKLTSARFRHLNEQLYTKPSSTSLSIFSATPSLFEEYHGGFRQQVAVWPENPVDGYISDVQKRATIDRHKQNKHDQSSNESQELRPLPRTSKISNIADLGCGDACLASTLTPLAQKLRIKIHSFDLHSPSPLITRSDISSLPLVDGSIDIAIFCLALMGTNWLDFIDEAYRIMRWGGELWVAEIKSRFNRSRIQQKKLGAKRKPTREEMEQEQDALLASAIDGGPNLEKTDVSGFVAALRRRGFLLAGENAHGTSTHDQNAIDMSNKMFVKLRFLKAIKPKRGKNVTADDVNVTVSRNANERFKKQKKQTNKFLDEIDDVDVTVEDEAKLLKPCVYKLR